MPLARFSSGRLTALLIAAAACSPMPMRTPTAVTTASDTSRKDRAAILPDARVPIIFDGSGIKPERYSEFAGVVDMAPTLGAIVHVTPQEKIDGHVLQHAVR